MLPRNIRGKSKEELSDKTGMEHGSADISPSTSCFAVAKLASSPYFLRTLLMPLFIQIEWYFAFTQAYSLVQLT